MATENPALQFCSSFYIEPTLYTIGSKFCNNFFTRSISSNDERVPPWAAAGNVHVMLAGKLHHYRLARYFPFHIVTMLRLPLLYVTT